MKKNIILVLFLGLFTSAFSQQGTLDSNFGLGEYSFVENENNEVLTAVEFANGNLYATGYKTISSDYRDYFPNKDSFFFYNRTTNKRTEISIGDNGSRANAIKYHENYIYLAGYSKDKNNKSIAVVKLHAEDGEIPNQGDFNKDSKIITDITNDDEANAIDIKNNKIWVAGKSGNQSIIVRYNLSTGYIDRTFNQKGFILYNIGTKSEIKQFKILSDDKMIIAGTASNGVNTDFFVAKLNADGSYDTSFGINGVLKIDFLGTDDRLNSMKILDNGKILLGGYCTKTPTNIDATIARVNANGTLDTTFKSTGKMNYEGGTKEDVFNYLDVKKNNWNEEIIHAIGYKKNTNYKDVFYVTFYADGSLERSSNVSNLSFYNDYLIGGAFGVYPEEESSSGLMTMFANVFCRESSGYFQAFSSTSGMPALPSSCGETSSTDLLNVNVIKERQDGKFYVVYQNKLKRYLSNGNIDLSFGDNGTFNEMFVSQFDLLPDNKLIVPIHKPGISTSQYTVIIDDNGKIVDNFEFKKFQGADLQYLNRMDYSPVTNKLYAYYATPYHPSLPNPVMCRYNLDGTIDTSFANNNQYIPITGSYGSSAHIDFQKIDLTSNGIVTIAFAENKKIITRYDLDGNLVSGFGNKGVVEISFTNGNEVLFKKILLDNVNNIYLMTEKIENSGRRVEVEKYNSLGSIDSSYGNNGVFSYFYDTTNSSVYFYDAKIQNDNKLLISGERSKPSEGDHGFVLRVNTNGTLDTTFGGQNNGVFSDFHTNNPNDFFETISVMGLTADNKIIVGGLNKTISVGNSPTYNSKIKKLK
ncbi:delta-60 repeat domain-containing protein [Epilithonimonas xixisoli]|uniref:Putative delta-60 repeat protein n=1 Tax=Epilithonimonas xixisoli TaxID=1476462 RepID=A0A4R8IFD7_9FLAO|nr:delta-60 repeat domain-containing protein [Epilithonimonas xixisoli]TDX84508.1 putative delta-60 repeat protein [Epilithonimonas xixisoli]